MTRLASACFLVGAIILGICATGPDVVFAQSASSGQPDHVQVYYFYTSSRCQNCYNMENWTKEVVEHDFQNEVAAGSVAFRTINMEKKENAHFVDQYRLYTKAVILSVVKNGEEARCENLLKVWEYLNNKERFKQYVKEALAKAVRDLL